MLKENEQLKKEMININLQPQQRKYEIIKKVKENNLKEELKIMNKEQIQQSRKHSLRKRESNENIKDLEKAKRQLENKCNIKNNKP